jgi:hypothetical protein
MGGAALGASLGVSVSGAGWRQYGKSVSNKARPRRAAQFAVGDLQMGDSENSLEASYSLALWKN